MLNRATRGTLIVSCLLALVLGWFTAALGPVLPELAGRTASSLADLGAIFTALFLGALIAQTLTGPVADRCGLRRVLLAGLSLLAVGGLGVVVGRRLPMVLGAALVAGIGQGAVDVGVNVLIAQTFAERRVTALNVLNLFFGVGAVAGPALVSLALASWATGLPALVAALLILAALLPLTVRFLKEPPRSATTDEVRPAARQPLYGSPLLWTLGALLVVYVGIENGMGGWTTTYVQATTALSIETAALVTSGFWLALTAGRAIGALAGARLAPHRLLLVCLVGSVIGGPLLALSAGNTGLTVTAVLLLGLSFGAIFPTVVAMTTEAFRTGPGKATSVVTAMGSIGGMTLPWVQGQLLRGQGPAACALFTAAGAFAMLAFFAATRVLQHKHSIEADDRPAPSRGDPGQAPVRVDGHRVTYRL